MHGDAFSGASPFATLLGAPGVVRPIGDQPRQEDAQRVWWGRPWALPGKPGGGIAAACGRGFGLDRCGC
ncbi:hypothetical protein ADK76_29040 [Streptomyces griseoflavus]|nr:hypothetical protein ADK76_29040 [Streptomyces griseoflavus]